MRQGRGVIWWVGGEFLSKQRQCREAHQDLCGWALELLFEQELEKEYRKKRRSIRRIGVTLGFFTSECTVCSTTTRERDGNDFDDILHFAGVTMTLTNYNYKSAFFSGTGNIRAMELGLIHLHSRPSDFEGMQSVFP